jgi:hypothetical protein
MKSKRREPVARKPSDVIPTSLRIRESLRRRVEAAAVKRQVSFNYEITSRVEASFDQESLFVLSHIVEDQKIVWARYGEAIHKLNMQGDLIRAAEALVAANEKNDPAAITAATDHVKAVIKLIENEAALALRKMHTT